MERRRQLSKSVLDLVWKLDEDSLAHMPTPEASGLEHVMVCTTPEL